MPSIASVRLLVSLATYNERDNLAPLLAEVHKVVPSTAPPKRAMLAT
ncbi:MAG TPA: hypothetical protein VH682_01435 [Gemmataceae bacterium]